MTVHGMHREASIEINASPEAVYDLVSDLPRMGEWSPENIGGEWQDGGSGQVGDRYIGHNRAGERAWSVLCIRDAPRRRPVCALDLPPGAKRCRHAGDRNMGCGTTPASAAEFHPGTTGRAVSPHRSGSGHDSRRHQSDG